MADYGEDIRLGIDTKGAAASLRDLRSDSKNLESSLKLANKEYDLASDKIGKMTNQQKSYQKQLQIQNAILKQQQDAYKKIDTSTDAGNRKASQLYQQLNKTKGNIADLNSGLNRTGETLEKLNADKIKQIANASNSASGKVRQLGSDSKTSMATAETATKSLQHTLNGLVSSMSSNMFSGLSSGAKGTFSSISSAGSTAFSALKSVASASISGIKSTISGLSKVASTVFNQVKNIASKTFGGIVNVAKTSISAITYTINGIKNVGTKVFSSLTSVVKRVFSGMVSVGKGSFNLLSTVGSKAFNIVKNVASVAMKAASGSISSLVSGSSSSFNKIVSIASTAFNRVKNVIGTVISTVSRLKNAIGSISGKIRSISLSGLSKLDAGLTKTIALAQKAAKAVGSGLQNVGGKIATAGQYGTLATGAVVAGGIGETAKSGVGYRNFETNSLLSYNTLMGSASKASKRFKEMQKFTLIAPYSLQSVVQADKNLQSYGMTAGKTSKTLKAMGDAISATGGTDDDFTGLSTALGQLSSNGHADLQDILQLQNRGIPAFKIMGNEMNMSVADFRTNVSKGKISSDDAMNALIKGLEQGTDGINGRTAKFNGMMQKQANTLSGAWGNMKDAWAQASSKMVSNEAYSKMKEGVLKLGDFIQKLPNIVRPASTEISNLFVKIVNLLEKGANAFTKMDSNRRKLYINLGLLSPAIAGAAWVSGGLIEKLGAIVSTFASFLTVPGLIGMAGIAGAFVILKKKVDDAGGGVKGVKKVVEDIKNSIKSFLSEINFTSIVNKAKSALNSVFKLVKGTISSLTKNTNNSGLFSQIFGDNRLGNTFNNLLKDIHNTIKDLFNLIKNGKGSIGQAFKTILDIALKIADTIVKLFDSVLKSIGKGGLGGTLNSILNTINLAITKLSKFITNGSLLNYAKSVWSRIGLIAKIIANIINSISNGGDTSAVWTKLFGSKKAGKDFSDLLNDIRSLILKIFSTIKGNSKNIKAIFIDIFDSITTVFDTVVKLAITSLKYINSNGGAIKNVFDAIDKYIHQISKFLTTGGVKNTLINLRELVITAVKSIFAMIKELIPYLEKGVNFIIKNLRSLFSFLAKELKNVLDAAKKVVNVFNKNGVGFQFTNLLTRIHVIIDNIFNDIKKNKGGILTFLANFVKQLLIDLNTAADLILGLQRSKVGGKAGQAANGLLKVNQTGAGVLQYASGDKAGGKQLIDGAVSKKDRNNILNFAKELKRAFNSIGSIVRGTFNTISAVIKASAKPIRAAINTIVNVFRPLNNLIGGTVKSVSKLFGSLGNASKNKKLSKSFGGMFSSLISILKPFAAEIGVIWRTINNLITNMSKWIDNKGNQKKMTNTFNSISNVFKTIKNAISGVLSYFNKFIRAINNLIGSKSVQSGLKNMSKGFNTALSPLKNLFKTVNGYITSFFNLLLKQFNKKSTKTSIGNLFTNIGNSVKPLKSVFSELNKIVKGLFNFAIGVINSKSLKSGLKNLSNSVKSSMSPISKSIKMIWNDAKGLINWALKVLKKYQKPIGKLLGEIATIVGKAFKAISVAIKAAISIINDFKSVFKGLGGVVDGVFGTILGILTGDGKLVKKSIGEILEGIFKMIFGILNGSVQVVLSAFAEILKGINSFAKALGKNNLIGKKFISGLNNFNGINKVGNNLIKKVEKSIPKFANGTSGFSGGLGWVGDGGLSELITTPNGQSYLSPNTATLLSMPRGTSVLGGIDTQSQLHKNISQLNSGIKKQKSENSRTEKLLMMFIALQEKSNEMMRRNITINEEISRKNLNLDGKKITKNITKRQNRKYSKFSYNK